MNGFLLINKPVGWTSHDVVAHLRRVTGIQKIGHAGTLDPFATGLLIVGIGRPATKRLDAFKQLPKTYHATIFLGAVSDTDDLTGRIQPAMLKTKQTPSREEIETAIKKFIGEQTQIPPMYSAKKVHGQKLYELARKGKGEKIMRQPHHIIIHDIAIRAYLFPNLTLEISCSPGTYIRALARDIGEALGIGAYAETLERTRIGTYTVQQAHEPQNITKENCAKFLFISS